MKQGRKRAPRGLLPPDWQLPALVDRRRKPRPARQTPKQRARAATRRGATRR